MASPTIYRLKIDLEPRQKLTLDPTIKIKCDGYDYELTALEFMGLYNNGTMALQIYCIDDEMGGSVPFNRLTHCIPGIPLAPNHFFVQDQAVADAFCAAGYIEPVVPVVDDGCKFCIHCEQTYTPKYATLQDAQANEDRGSIYAEQHLSGICSDECWDAVTKPDDY
eukprot:COSAG01_NODE_2495_length_7577_cov_26.851565_3_plen_166_part_00